MKYNLDRKNKERIDNLEKKKKVLTTWPYDKDGNLLLADELSPDGMRLWKKGTSESFDKDLFRKGNGDILLAYQTILTKLQRII